MTTYFVGAAVGSAVGSVVWKGYGWSGVCVAGLAFSVATVVVWIVDRRLESVGSAPSAVPASAA
jgi:predicted MFS family arabinose efflux permease